MSKKKTPKILKVYWSKREAKIGEKVKLEAVTQDAAGEIATIQIYEYRKKNRLIEELKIPVKASRVIASWKIKYVSDIYGEGLPEYRFKLSISKNSKSSKTLYLKAETVRIALTFDDGPHAASLKGVENLTKKVFDALRKRGIKAAFFIQTHAPHRSNSPYGAEIVRKMAKEGHIMGIHTGSLEDHADHSLRVRKRPEDVNGDGELDGKNGLESDLIRAKSLIKNLTGSPPEFVRAPYGRYKANEEILPAYRRQKLIHVLWDIDSMDNIRKKGRRRTADEVINELNKALKVTKLKEIILLFHDLNIITANNLSDYIKAIDNAVRRSGKIAQFTTDTSSLRLLLQRKGTK